MDNQSIHSPNLLRILINCAEKASNIARCCRADENLLALLTQEKGTDEANVRFEHDFKTLADVLIQETIKHDVGKFFPDLQNSIKGEESSIFTNKLGESVSVSIGKTQSDTAENLKIVLNKHETEADILATEVHKSICYDDPSIGEIPNMPRDLNLDNLGIWIDPIDATAEYISGEEEVSRFQNVSNTGLKCVTVLIGVYDRYTNEPIIGVISQPFYKEIQNKYQSKILWGVALPNVRTNNCCKINQLQRNERLALFSKSEHTIIVESFEKFGFNVSFPAGAGYKILKIILDDADLFILDKNTTFKWDTCAPHAILRSLGGDIYDLKRARRGDLRPLKYFMPPSKIDEDIKCNQNGLLALRNIQLIDDILPIILQ